MAEAADLEKNMNLSTVPSQKDSLLWRYVVFGEKSSFGPATILLVEDDRFVRTVTGGVLTAAGHDVLTAGNAAEALRVCEGLDHNIELLITDLVLPGDSGRTVAQRLKQRNLQMKVLFISGYIDQVRLAGTSSHEFLAKPFSASELLGRVAQLLEDPSRITQRERTAGLV